jgi:hypothetical protein
MSYRQLEHGEHAKVNFFPSGSERVTLHCQGPISRVFSPRPLSFPRGGPKIDSRPVSVRFPAIFLDPPSAKIGLGACQNVGRAVEAKFSYSRQSTNYERLALTLTLKIRL